MKKLIKKLSVGILSLSLVGVFSSNVSARSYSAVVIGAPRYYACQQSYGVVDYDETEAYPYYPYFPSEPSYDRSQPYGVNPFHPLANRHLRHAPSYNAVYMH